MNNLYVQNSSLARLWAVLTMLAVVLSAFSAPFSVFAEEQLPVEPPTEVQTPANDGDDLDDGEDGEDGQLKKMGDDKPSTAAFVVQGNPGNGNNGHDEITICHANESNEHANNPFTDNEVDEDGLNGHDGHGDDIIPVTDDFPNGQNLGTVYPQFGGLTGQQILDDECDTPEPEEEVMISITKIICEDESLLPNDGYTEITASTAADFLAQNPSCYLGEDFEFQWALGGQSNQSSPDNQGELGSPWNTSEPTGNDGNVVITLSEDEVDDASKISVREVWSSDYIPFAGSNNGNVSAELYCAKDAANFDNLEWISGVKLDNTYHCVAWNVPEVPDPVTCELVIESDELDLVEELNAYAKLLTTVHPAWVQFIPSSVAEWIWGDDPVVAPTTVEETQTFKKSFVWNGLTIDSAVLTIASDNSHDITLGTFSGGDAGEHNYAATKDYDVETAIVNGLNTLEIAVKNFGVANTNPSSNPAGLIYKLKITGTGTSKDCGEVVPLEPVTPKFSDVTMCKIDGNQNALKGWNLMLLGAEVDTVEVSATNGVGTDVALDAGSYVAVASGTWDNNRSPLKNIVDAEYSTEDNWATHMDGFTGFGTEILELQVGGAFGDWGAYNSLHRYARAFTQAVDGTTNFAVSDTNYADNTGSLDVAVYEGYAGLTGENGCVVFEDVPFGTYNVDEIMQDGWLNATGLGEVTVDSETETFTVINRPIDTPDEDVATVIAHKIVCTDEADLPNWGVAGGANITPTTAADWVASHDSCEFEAGWEFEWAPQGTPNPDDNLPTSGYYGAVGGNWTAFGPTDVNGKTQVTLSAAQIAGMSNIWMREVLKDGYIPFTYGPGNLVNTNDFSAEMYCHTDVLNYDNYDRVDGIAVDNTYHCVAWNHAETPAPVCKVDVNLLANGGFELPVVTDAADWDIFDFTANPVIGWAVAWMNGAGAPAEASLELHAGVNGWLTTEGLQYAELDSDWQGPGGTSGEAASVAITQTVPTVLGQNYSLSWSFSPRPNTTASQNVLEVLVNNVVVDTNTAAGGANTVWTPDNYVFVGTGAPVTVTFRDAGISNSEGTFLDNVSLNCRPADNGGGDGENGDDTYRLEGYVWNDDNRNTEWELEGEVVEVPLSGWTVKATKGETTYSTTTDEFGYYYFDVPAGTWTISQEVQTDWEQTTTPIVHEVTVPVEMTQGLVERVLAYIIPVAHAALLDTFGDYNFGNDFVGTTPTPTVSTGGGGGGGGGRLVRSTPTVAGDSISTPAPTAMVLGEQVSAVPYGAPGTGNGGTSSTANTLTLLQILFVSRKRELVK